jgi:hypothetical protein
MAFIRLKQERKGGKIYSYYYFCIRRRSGKKDGGNGEIKCPDKLIGKKLTGKYLEFWIWDGLSPTDYLEAMVSHEMNRRGDFWGDYYLSRIRWWIDWKFKKGKAIAGKLKFRAVELNGFKIDARKFYPKLIRENLQWQIDYVLRIGRENPIGSKIDSAAFYLFMYEREKNTLAGYEKQYSQWQKEFRKGKADRDDGDRLMELMEEYRYKADEEWQEYQAKITKLLDMAPPLERERFKAAIIRQTEKLAASPNFLDRYEVS